MSANEDPKEPTSASAWKKPQGKAVEMPSGNTALLRPASIDTFMRKGLIPNPLLQMFIDVARDGDEGGQKKMVRELMSSMDQSKIDDIFSLYDSVALYCVVAPHVSPIPHWNKKHVGDGVIEEESVGQVIPIGDPNRDTDKLYVDEVDIEDKSYIFQWAMGSAKSLESFREGLNRNVGDLLASKDVELSAQQPARSGG